MCQYATGTCLLRDAADRSPWQKLFKLIIFLVFVAVCAVGTVAVTAVYTPAILDIVHHIPDAKEQKNCQDCRNDYSTEHVLCPGSGCDS